MRCSKFRLRFTEQTPLAVAPAVEPAVESAVESAVEPEMHRLLSSRSNLSMRSVNICGAPSVISRLWDCNNLFLSTLVELPLESSNSKRVSFNTREVSL